MIPQARSIVAHGLPHRLLTWSPSVARGRVFLLHGFADCGANWDLVAPALARAGYLVHAPDFRGYGESAWVPEGGYYHFADHVFDLADIIACVVDGEPELPVHVVGHSMGGTVATLYAGAFPETVRSLVLCEGLGPPDNEPESAPDRMRRWVDSVRKVEAAGGRTQKPFDSLSEAATRMRLVHSAVPHEILTTRAANLVKKLEGERVAWAFDPLHRTAAPTMFSAETFKHFARRITCPVLFVDGGPNGFHPPDEADRLRAFARARTVSLPTAGHMMHWTAPTALSAELLAFLEPITSAP